MNYEFINYSILDFSADESQFVYSYTCPTYMKECRNENDSDWRGWLFFALLMIGNELADFISGIKLLMLSGAEKLSSNKRIRFFIGGTCLCFVSSLTVIASTLYNRAIARSNPDIVG